MPKSASGNNLGGDSGTELKAKVSLWSPEQEAQLGKRLPLFTSTTKSIVWGMQLNAVQVRGGCVLE